MKGENIPEPIKSMWNQLYFLPENLAGEFGVSFKTVNCWENGKVFPSKMTHTARSRFCSAIIETENLKLAGMEL
jgi:DNA-binding XRE family transcriptional regulator